MQLLALYRQLKKMWKSENIEPIKIELRLGIQPVRKKQYPISKKAKQRFGANIE